MSSAENKPTSFAAFTAPLAARWTALTPRDRKLAAFAGVVLGLFFIWTLAVQPALRSLASAPAEIDALDVQLQAMQRLAAETKELRAAPPVTQEAAAAVLTAATQRLGEQGKLALQGDRAILTVTGIGTAALSDWLAEARAGARARPLEATLTRAAQGYNGTIIVAFGSGS